MHPSYTAELLTNKINKDYADDVAIVVVYGSVIYDDTHSRSDLDLFFVPKTERGYRLGFTFIIEGIGFDFWPISWERLERIANHDERIASIITDGKVVYFSSAEDMEHFNEIKEKALDISDHKKFLQKASAKMDETYNSFFQMQHAENLSEIRKYAIGLTSALTDALALLNRISVKRGRGKLKTEIMNMPLVPERFSELYDTVFFCSDSGKIKKAYDELIKNTESLLLREREKYSKPHLFAEALSGFYEELINAYNKIYHSCETRDPVTALFASVELTHEIDQAFKGTGVSSRQLPDIVGAYDPADLSGLCQAARTHQNEFVNFLKSNGVAIRELRALMSSRHS